MQEASLYGTQMIKVAPGNAAGQVGLDVLLHGERDTRMPGALAQRLLVDLRIAACCPEQDKTARCVGGGPLVVIRSRAPRCQL